jgi:hypothetical protein
VELQVGGLSRIELSDRLAASGVLMNAHAETLLGHSTFDKREGQVIAVVARAVGDLDVAESPTLPAIFAAARRTGLELCPADTAPYLRLLLADQYDAVGQVESTGRAPDGALTVAAEILHDDDDYPKGFYLRVIAGQSWLRGYRCDDEHEWSLEDRFVFRRVADPA